MKLILSLILAATCVFGQQTFSPKCDCHADNFMAELYDERRCLTKVDPNGIDNCLETDWDSTHGLECTKCAPTHAIDEKKRCIPHELPECIDGAIKTGMGVDSEFPTYTDGFVCSECSGDFFVNQNGWCTAFPTNITECKTYQFKAGGNENTTECAACNTGFWLQVDDKTQATSCLATPVNTTTGIITNCKTYINNNGTADGFECDECETGFWLDQSDAQLETSCLPTPVNTTTGIITNCKTYINNNGTADGFECDECETGFWLDQTDAQLETSCLPTPVNTTTGIITNCKTYVNTNGTADGFRCDECEDNFWLQADNKFEETSCPGTPPNATAGRIDNCKLYINANGTAAGYTCDECEDTYIVNTAADTCWATPTSTTENSTWTENCKTWSHPTTKYQCTACEGHFWLDTSGSEPVCAAVQLNIDNCITYSNAQTCTVCADRYWLENGICVQCPAEKYVAPTPVVCNGTTPVTPTPTNGTGGNPGGNPTNGTGGNPTNGTNSNSIILSAGVAIALSLVLL